MEKGETRFARWKQKLFKTRQFLLSPIEKLIIGKKSITPEVIDELEEILIRADIGVALSDRIVSELRRTTFRAGEDNLQKIKELIGKRVLGILGEESPLPKHSAPLVILIVGVNGSGKTSTVGKLAHYFCKINKRVLVAAADTFRAAAIEQLEIWQKRAGVDIVKGKPGGDAAAVVYDAGKLLSEKGYQVLLIDTAGRLHTKTNLMEELKKIKRAIDKVIPGSFLETLLVLDATCGQNGIQQAKIFQEVIDITGIVLTKLDGSSKGGIVISIKENLNVPVKLIGLGEEIGDLEDFSPKDFVHALLDN